MADAAQNQAGTESPAASSEISFSYKLLQPRGDVRLGTHQSTKSTEKLITKTGSYYRK